MKLSVIIACVNDHDIANTVSSIRDTDAFIEIVIVDDASLIPVESLVSSDPYLKVIRNTRRVGCGPSRYVGALYASGEYLLFVDAHCRFEPGWYRNAVNKLSPKVLHCGVCVPLPANNKMEEAKGAYYGADFKFFGPDNNNPKLNQVMECVWAREKMAGPGDGEYEIQAVMGACYFIQRQWFLELDALRALKTWGQDEMELSLKAWLSGGEVRQLKNVRIGHKFREGRVQQTYVMPWHVARNKLFVMHTCLPVEKAMYLQMKMQRDAQFGMALKAIREDWNVVETCRAYNANLFIRDFTWLCGRFGITFPN